MIVLFNVLMRDLTDLGLLAGRQLTELVVRPALLVLALGTAVAARRVELADLADDPGWKRHRAVLVVAAVLLLAGLSSQPLVYSLLPVIAASVWLGRVRTQVPETLEVMPAGAGRSSANASADDPADAAAALGPVGASRWAIDRVVMRQLFKWPLNWIVMLPFLVLFGLLLAGFLPGSEGNAFGRGYLRAVNWFIVVYLMYSSVGHFLENLWRVDHLPLSRRRLMAWLVLPTVIFLMLGYGVGIVLLERSQQATEQLLFDNDEEN